MEHHGKPREFQESFFRAENVEGITISAGFPLCQLASSSSHPQHLTHKNIAKLLNSFYKDNKLYLVLEVMQDNLNNIIRTQRLQSDDIRYIIHQILSALNYLHRNGIIHGDLKPSDIGINKDFSVKIIDLNAERPKETDYVLTKWLVKY
jgi:serine/threonine protein kinase